MAKENVAKFFEALNKDKSLAEKLMAAEKAYSGAHEAPANSASKEEKLKFREEAMKEVLLPLAKEAGFPFTLEEMKAAEQENPPKEELSEDEMEKVAGGFTIGFCIGSGFTYTPNW